jgi:hypothetical protein
MFGSSCRLFPATIVLSILSSPAILSRLPYPSTLTPQFFCLRCPLHAVIFWLACLSVLSLLSCHGCRILGVTALRSSSAILSTFAQGAPTALSRLPCPIFSVLVVLPQFSPLCPAPIVLSQLHCPSCSVLCSGHPLLSVLFRLSCSNCPVPAVMHLLSCNGCAATVVLTCFPVPAVLSCHILAILSRQMC